MERMPLLFWRRRRSDAPDPHQKRTAEAMVKHGGDLQKLELTEDQCINIGDPNHQVHSA